MLIVCEACKRHIKNNETQCPFCQQGTAPTSSRLQRVATVALVGVSLGLAGCPRPATKYGAPPPINSPTSQSDTPTSQPTPEPEHPAVKYGAPPPPRR